MISYQVYFRQPELHYIEIEMKISVENPQMLELYMPTWTPGSYMIREYSKNLDQFQVLDGSGDKIPFQKINKKFIKAQATFR